MGPRETGIYNLIGIAVDGVHGERWQTHGDVLGAVGARGAIAHPFAGVGDHCLAGGHVDDAVLVLDANHAAKHNRDLLEIGTLARLFPTRRRLHASDADVGVARVHAAGVFLDALRWTT